MSQSSTRPGHAWPLSSWLAILSLALGTFALVSSEFLPAGLLTLMADDLGVSEGVAGQAVTATAIFGAIAAPTVALVIGRIDRKVIMLLISIIAIVSNVAVALATEYWMLLVARMLIGVAIGGFWALAGATVVRLVSMQGFGRGMSIIFMGVSAATIAAPPLGALVGEVLGWRAAFWAVSLASLVALLVQAFILPSVPASGATSLSTLFGLLGRSKVRVGLLATLLVAGGHFAGFTFIRPYLEGRSGMGAGEIAVALLAFGAVNFIGNGIGGVAADRMLRLGFTITCILLGFSTLALALWGTTFLPSLLFTALWGFSFGAAPVMTQTWMGRAAPDQLEGVGGLFVATFQVAIALGAVLGGASVDFYGVIVPLYITAIGALLAAVLIAAQRSAHPAPILAPGE